MVVGAILLLSFFSILLETNNIDHNKQTKIKHAHKYITNSPIVKKKSNVKTWQTNIVAQLSPFIFKSHTQRITFTTTL
jgi:hypothetical protein